MRVCSDKGLIAAKDSTIGLFSIFTISRNVQAFLDFSKYNL